LKVATRAFDIVLGCVVLLAGLPVLVAIAAAVALFDGTPILFRQLRVGRGGSDFELLKFRTMVPREGAEDGSFEPGSRTRVTRLGGLLRRSKLDELPQVWNVLRGDMSLVGPRPEVRRWVDAYPQRWCRVLSVRPGLTDPASIEFRREEELLAASSDPERLYRETVLPRKLDLYEEYVENRTLVRDLSILWHTMREIVNL
jgi:lipopolysaccharide/colanic/teichoic acid biosynthesis glycosyltransferase